MKNNFYNRLCVCVYMYMYRYMNMYCICSGISYDFTCNLKPLHPIKYCNVMSQCLVFNDFILRIYKCCNVNDLYCYVMCMCEYVIRQLRHIYFNGRLLLTHMGDLDQSSSLYVAAFLSMALVVDVSVLFACIDGDYQMAFVA